MPYESKERRKNYFIKRQFQRNFIIKFCVLVIIGSVISSIVVYVMSKSTVTTTFENARLVIKSTADFILPAVLFSSAIVVTVIGLATVVVTLFTSHKIAGPLYRMEKDVEAVASGDLRKKFNLRRTDELKALAESFDNMTQSFRDKIDGIKHAVTDLESTLQTSGKLSDDSKEKISNLKKQLSEFNT